MRHLLHDLLEEASRRNRAPRVIAYNRIDGPGSSMDLREVQQAFWTLPATSNIEEDDPALTWSAGFPRTVCVSVNIGTQIQAMPFEPDKISVRSVEYGTEVIAKPGEVLPTKENWLLKIIEIFGLVGVQFVLQNLRGGMQSSGLGGSATATTGVCLLANELAGRPFSPPQLLSLASRMEQDLGVSLTGTQEQANVIFGGVTDYVWFPWGIPGRPESGFGQSVRRELLPPSEYEEVESRMAIFHSGLTRASADTNLVWMKALSTEQGYRLHRRKLEVAYEFAEALRLKNWGDVLTAIREYRELRTALCPDYMNGAGEILGFAERKGCTAFPLGAGGGGAILVYGPDPHDVEAVRLDLQAAYREIPFRIMAKGHDLMNLPLEE